MMPYTARAIVGSKYVLGLMLVLPVLALSMLSRLLVHSTPIVSEETMSLLITACLSLILMAIDLPFMFHFGVEKGRLIYILLTCVFVVAGVNYAGKLAEYGQRYRNRYGHHRAAAPAGRRCDRASPLLRHLRPGLPGAARDDLCHKKKDG